MPDSTGMIGFIYGINPDQVRAEIKKYKRKRPRDKRSEADLWPYAINGIVNKLKNEGQV